MEILYEDNHLLIVLKAAGLLTQPTEENGDSLETRLKAWIKERDKKPGAVFLHALHRLDKPVSGLVLFAKTSKALSRLGAAMRAKHIQRYYLARLDYPWTQEGVLQHHLARKEFYSVVSASGKRAELKYRCRDGLCEIELLTGRHHQIRVQFAAAGYPIRGDVKYGSQFPQDRIDLHCWKLVLIHPVTHLPVVVEAPVQFAAHSMPPL